jgi:putative endonuclease
MVSRDSTHDVGRRYEALAANWLRARGWQVVERNVRRSRKEVDLVVRRGEVVAFVEVKARRGGGFGHPLEAVTWRKRREIEGVARAWLRERGGARANHVYRFDVLAVVHTEGCPPLVDHLPDAWRLGE